MFLEEFKELFAHTKRKKKKKKSYVAPYLPLVIDVQESFCNLIFYHKPYPLERVRLCSHNEVYDPQQNIKNHLRKEVKFFVEEEPDFYHKGLHIKGTFYTPLPRCLSEKQKKLKEGSYDCKRPDLDNYIKFYLDLLTGILWKDDNQIVSLDCSKVKSVLPKVCLEISVI